LPIPFPCQTARCSRQAALLSYLQNHGARRWRMAFSPRLVFPLTYPKIPSPLGDQKE